MIIKKIINTSFVLVDDDGIDKIVMGKGIGFHKKRGDAIEPEEIQHIFSPAIDTSINNYIKLVEEIPEVYFALAKEIISIVQEELQIELDNKIFIGLTDHIYYAIERHNKGIVLQNRLLWEIKAFHKKEFAIGCKAIALINDKIGVQLNEEEAGNIAYYIVTASAHHPNMESTIQSIALLKDIISIINLSFHGSLQVDSLSYQRMITHLQFFIQRLQENKVLTGNDTIMFEIYKERYPECYRCVGKIREHIKKQMGIDIGIDEQLYLLIHIVRNILP